MRIRLFGHHMVYAVLAATAVGVADGRALDHMVPALEKLQPSPGRLELITLPSGAYILRDDFKSTLETINAALDVLEQIPARRRLVALGDVSEPPGSQGPIYRSIGARLAEIASWVIFICDQRGKQSYAAGAAREGMPRDAMLHAGKSVLKAAELLHSELKAGDVVLIKGRDNQRLDRITLALSGHNVRCDMSFCNLSSTRRCANCNLLGYG
jgi:UDP-N-acetylmuramyl pentapeptide synthase